MKPKQLKHKEVAEVREAILCTQQQGVCAVCKCTPKRPCLDHSHVKRIKGTGLIRGVLCSSCNVFIAKSENNCMRYGFSQKELPKILRSMADYLERDHYPFIHPSEAPKQPILTKRSYASLRKWWNNHYRGRASLPKYRVDEKGKPIQKMTKPLNKWFALAEITPRFYGEKR